ncbi:hypothetical protein [Pseudomonas sp. 18175]|uniref:hypothetical protein n=1 Tax=Pseudomonas sp. 18175 TaxID=3390056 RepID=UPI003D20B90D
MTSTNPTAYPDATIEPSSNGEVHKVHIENGTAEMKILPSPDIAMGREVTWIQEPFPLSSVGYFDTVPVTDETKTISVVVVKALASSPAINVYYKVIENGQVIGESKKALYRIVEQ